MARRRGNIEEISDKFEALVTSHEMTWHAAGLEELPEGWIRAVAERFLSSENFSWLVGNIRIDGAVCIKLDNPFLQYLDIYPGSRESEGLTGQFMWCTNNHHNSVRPDEALVYMMKRRGLAETSARTVLAAINAGLKAREN